MSTLVTLSLLLGIMAALAGIAFCAMVMRTGGSSTRKVLASTGTAVSILVLIALIATLLRSATPSGATTILPHSGSPSTTSGSPSGTTSGIQHYEYVFPDGSVAVYDMDHGHKLVKQLSLPTTDGVRGVVGNTATHRLYISHGSDGDSGGSLLAYDLLTDTILWNKTYAHGIDSMAITPDGKTIYMPDGETANAPYWYVINAADGSEQGTKINGGPGPHNTVVSLNGAHVYMGSRNFADRPTFLTMADTTTNSHVRTIGPFQSGVRPFTINSRETLAYVTTTGLLGFQVAAIQSGRVLYTVDLTRLGFPNNPTGPTAPSHGIALSPDEKTVAVIDWPHDMVHLFDVTRLPNAAPQKTADITFSRSIHHNEAGCAYDCAADGWLEYSRDGRFLYVGDVGDVVDTATNTVVTNISTLYNTRKMLEVDFQHGAVSYVPNNRASVGYGAPSSLLVPPEGTKQRASIDDAVSLYRPNAEVAYCFISTSDAPVAVLQREPRRQFSRMIGKCDWRAVKERKMYHYMLPQVQSRLMPKFQQVARPIPTRFASR